MPMLAFHNDPTIKDQYLERVRQHRAADELIKGVYWEQYKNGTVKWKGCAVGCTIHGSDHSAYERELGISRVLARLEDDIFEGLPLARAMEWPEQFLSAIAVGADLARVWPLFAVWLLDDETDGVIRFARTDEQRKAIRDVADAYRQQLDGATIDADTWWNLRYAAAAAAAADADAAADAATAAADAADAAYTYTYADAAADAAAAYTYAAAAADAADADAAREAAMVRQADKLLELLATAQAKKVTIS